MTDTKDGCASSTTVFGAEVDKLEEAGRKAAAFMEELWKQDIFDPPKGSSHPRAKFCLDTINDIIAYNGWSWVLPYRWDGDKDLQWCGMTAGRAWGEAGLDTSWLVDYFASTWRLHSWATYQRWKAKAKANPAPVLNQLDRRLLVDIRKGVPDSVDPRLGDIVIVGDGDPRVGDHVTVNMGYNATKKTFDTISGNGGGVSPRGTKNNGVSRRDYTIGQSGYKPMWLIRPALSDLL